MGIRVISYQKPTGQAQLVQEEGAFAARGRTQVYHAEGTPLRQKDPHAHAGSFLHIVGARMPGRLQREVGPLRKHPSPRMPGHRARLGIEVFPFSG